MWIRFWIGGGRRGGGSEREWVDGRGFGDLEGVAAQGKVVCKINRVGKRDLLYDYAFDSTRSENTGSQSLET